MNDLDKHGALSSDLLDSHFHEIIHRGLNSRKTMAIHIRFFRNVLIHMDHNVIEKHSKYEQWQYPMKKQFT